MARKTGPDVEAFLRRPDPRYPVVLLYGPDAGLVSERARALARAAASDPDDPFQLIRLDGDEIASDPPRLAEEAHTLGLFGGRRVLWVRAGSRNLAPSIEPLLAAPPRDALVVIEAGDLAPRAPLRAMMEKAAAGVALPCFLDETKELLRLIDAILAQHHLTIAAEPRALLVRQLGSDHLLSRREIEKLALYAHGDRQVEWAHIEAVVADATALALDQMIDAVFLGESETADRALTRLLAEGEDPGMLIGAVLRHALSLHRARLQQDGGAGQEEIDMTARIFARRKAAFRRQISIWSVADLDKALASLREAQIGVRRNARMGDLLASRAILAVALGARGR